MIELLCTDYNKKATSIHYYFGNAVLGGFKLALSAQKVFSALLGTPRSLVYAMAPISGLFIILAQIINIYEDVTGITIEGGNE